MVAADIANETLEKGKEGYVISEASSNVVTYFASDDMALRGSKIANVRNGQLTRRLGHTGPENIKKLNNEVPDNVYAIDCSDINSKYDTSMGHTYFIDDEEGKPNKVFNHIKQILATGRVEANDRRIAEII